MYGLITEIRNYLFDKQIIASKKHKNIYVLCVGNLRVGGTGKTPMVEYLIKNLKEDFNVAVVSLGYKRQSKGLREISQDDTFLSVGDEPKQMSVKFPDVKFVVNKDRNQAIEYIKNKYPDTQVIILDDAYQYRKTIPTKTILLTEYSRPFYEDKVIPYGRLRESDKNKKRADYIVVTKTPNGVSENQKQGIISRIKVSANQTVFFSQINYAPLPQNLIGQDIILIAGIDNPTPLQKYLETQCKVRKLMKFPDHYAFQDKDIKQIKQEAERLNCQIVTTEKDYARLKRYNLNMFVQTIEIKVDNNFINIIKDDIRKYFRS
ncbi:MAG: tetraacyldisaccharide 4'-kinase [Bacteroidales bacterium]|nr:tetraacyldisaccharide 4'-kinase [Bacteroidales bacterium]